MGNYVNYQSVIDQLQAFGLMVNTLEVGRTTTKRVAVDTAKCPVDKEKRKSAGWYKLNAFSIDGNTYIVGSFGYWKGSDNNAVKVEWKKEWSDNLTPEQRQAMADAHKASIKLAEAERKREIEHCANMAQTNWLKLKTEGDSGYLAKKQVGAFGIKFHPKKDLIAVPVTDTKGKLFALQLIRSGLPADSKIPSKQFWPRGAEIKGHFHTIGNLAGAKVIFIAEGYATGASIHTAINAPVVVAFNANNLTPVAKEIAKANKYAKIVICADDDYLTDGNPGVTQAQNAALSVGGEWVKPDFMVAGTDIRNGEKLTDFNDLHVHPQGGLRLVTAQLAQHVTGAQPKPTTATSAGGDKQGEGERRSTASAILSVDEIVERFVFIDDQHGDNLFDKRRGNIVKIKKVQHLLPPKVRWEEVKAHYLWSANAVYDYEIGFDPTGKDETIKCNKWTGWKTTPANYDKPEDHCVELLGLLHNLCSQELNQAIDGHENLFKWLVQWLAYPIQNPGAKMKTALIFHGPQGAGKNMFFDAYRAIYGDEHSSIITQDTMEDQFNSDWAEQKLFVLADEIVAVQERTHIKNKLKTMVTGDRVRINQKMIAAYSEKNHYNMVFLSNELNPVVLEHQDRRYFVIWTPEKREKAYYDRVDREIKNGGIAALHQFLLNYPLDDFNPNAEPPMTRAKQDLIFLNLDTPKAFYTEWSRGMLDIPFMPCPTVALYGVYQKWCFKQGEKIPRPQRQFVSSLVSFGAKSVEENHFKNYHREHPKKSYFIVPRISDYLKALSLGIPCGHPDADESKSETKRDKYTTYFIEMTREIEEMK